MSPFNRIDADGHFQSYPGDMQSACGSNANSCQQANSQTRGRRCKYNYTEPPAPIVLPALGEAAKDLVGGLIETLAAPLIILDYLVSPGTTATEDKDTIHGPPAFDITAGGGR